MKTPFGSSPLIEITRGEYVESVHHGTIAVANSEGQLIAFWGDPQQSTFMRSSAKPFQALPLLESGAAEELQLRPQELALICASHTGQRQHLEVLNQLIRRTDVNESQLQCGLHRPLDNEAAFDLRRAGEEPTVLHNNCAGKHIGMLAACQHLGYSVEDYLAVDHPLQQRILETLAQLAQVERDDVGVGTDGCSAPNFLLPIRAIATAFAQLVDPKHVDDHRAGCLEKIVAAMTQYPDLVSGPTKLDALLMKQGNGDLVAKRGAEGVLGLGLRGIDGDGLGVAIKIWDGDNRGRAISAAALEALDQIGWLTAGQRQSVEEVNSPAVVTRRGEPVGRVRPGFTLERAGG